MAPKKDDLGIEIDDDVEAVLKDPKGGLLVKTFDYLGKRKAAELAKEAEEQEKKQPKKKGIFNGIFGENL